MTTIESTQDFGGDRFRRTKSTRFGGVIVVLAFLLGSMSASGTTKVVWVYMGVGAFVIAFLSIGLVRSSRIGIRLTDVGVEARTTYSTRRWTWDEIIRARTRDQEVRTSPYAIGVTKNSKRDERTRIYPILDLKGGQDARLYGLQTVTKGYNDSDWLDDAILTINRVVATRRGESDSSARPR